MNLKKLDEIILNGESLEVEFKQSFHNVQEIARIICAFANTQGGVLIIGINDSGKVIGLTSNLDDLQQKISAANRMVYSNPIINIEIHKIESKKVVLVIVHKSDVSVFHTVEGVVFVRVGTTIQKLEGNSVLEFLRNKQFLLFEEGSELNAKISDIDENKIVNFLNKRNQENYLKSHSIIDFLKSKKLLIDFPEIKLKNAALLFFAKNPSEFFSHIKIKLVRFDGIEPVKVIAYEEASGTLPEMIEHSINFVSRFLSKEFVIKGIKREEISVLPEGAVREAIINAVAHRDYFNFNEIQLSFFDDRIEIISPGGLPDGMSEELLGVLSVQRNPVIYQLLKDYGYMEGIGSGISKIYSLMAEAHLEKPEFFVYPKIFRIVFKLKKTIGVKSKLEFDLNERQEKAMDFLRVNKKIKSAEYSKMNKVSVQTATRDLKELEKIKLVKKKGSFRNAIYVLNE